MRLRRSVLVAQLMARTSATETANTWSLLDRFAPLPADISL
jgi:hypothetical protein